MAREGIATVARMAMLTFASHHGRPEAPSRIAAKECRNSLMKLYCMW